MAISRAWFLAAILGTLNWTTAIPAATPLDAYGDPLPPGAIARLGSVGMHHADPIVQITFTPDGKSLLAVTAAGDVCCWDSDTGHRLPDPFANNEAVRQLAFSTDGKSLLTVDGDGAVEVNSVATGELVQRIRNLHQGWVRASLSEHDQVVAETTRPNAIQIWKLGPAGLTKTRAYPAVVQPVLLPNDAPWLVSWNGKDFQRREATTSKVLIDYVGLTRPEFGGISPDDHVLAAVGDGGKVVVWAAESGEQLWQSQLAPGTKATSLRFSPDGNKFAVNGTSGLHIYDLATHRRSLAVTGGRYELTCWSPDSRRLAVYVKASRSIAVFDVATGKPATSFVTHHTAPAQFDFIANGKCVATSDGTVRVWNSRSGKLEAAFPQFGNGGFAEIPNSDKLLATGKLLSIWNYKTAETKELPFKDLSTFPAWTPAVSNDGEILAGFAFPLTDAGKAAGKGILLCWSDSGTKIGSSPVEERPLKVCVVPNKRNELLALTTAGPKLAADAPPPHQKLVLWTMDDPRRSSVIYESNGAPEAMLWDLAVSPDGSRAALAADKDGGVLIDLKTKKALRAWKPDDPASGLRTLAFSGDSKRLLGGVNPVCVWDAVSGERVSKITDAEIRCSAISHNGKWAAAGNTKGEVVLWDIAADKIVARFVGHDAGVAGLRFSPDDAFLASSSYDTTVLIWNLDMTGVRRVDDVVVAPPDNLDELWEKLAVREAPTAYRAAHEMIGFGNAAVEFLAKKLPVEVLLPRTLPYEKPEQLRWHRVAFVLDHLAGEAAHALRERIQIEPSAFRPYAHVERKDSSGELLPSGAVLSGGTDKFAVSLTPESPLAVSAEGALLATYSNPRPQVRGELTGEQTVSYLQFWDISTGEVAKTVPIPVLDVSLMTFTADGKFLVYGSADGAVSVIDVARGKLTADWDTKIPNIAQLEIAPDGKTAYTAHADGTVAAWKLPTGEAIARTDLDKGIVVNLYPGDDRVAVIANTEKGLQSGVWVPGENAWAVRKSTADKRDFVAMAVDGKRYLYAALNPASGKAAIELRDAVNDQAIKKINEWLPFDQLKQLEFFDDWRMLTVATTGHIRLTKVETGEPLAELRPRPGRFARSPDRSVIAVGTERQPAIINVNIAQDLVAVALAKSKSIRQFSSANGKLMLSERDGQIVQLDGGTLEPQRALLKYPVIEALSPDGRFALATSLSSTPSVFELASRTCLCRVSNFTRGWAAFHADGRRLTLVGEAGRELTILDLIAGTSKVAWRTPEDSYRKGGLSPDGRMLCVADSPEGFLTCFNTETGGALWKAQRPRAYFPIFSHDSRTLTVDGIGEPRVLLDAATGNELQSLVPAAEPNPAQRDPTVSPFTFASRDGNLFAIADGAQLTVYESSTRTRVAVFKTGQVEGMTFLDGGRFLETMASRSGRKTIVWDLAMTADERRTDEPMETQLRRLWPDLDSEDGGKAHAAIWAYAAAGDDAVEFLQGKLPEVAPDKKAIEELIRQLGDDNFNRREAAERKLAKAGRAAVGPLSEAAKNSRDVEIRTRSEKVLKELSQNTTPRIVSRIIKTLSQIDTPQARKLLARIQASP